MNSLNAWSNEKLYLDNDLFFDSLEKAIDESQTTIDIEIYIFRLDKLGLQIANALVKAAARGVKVRLLVDSVGSMPWGNAIVEFFTPVNGVELKFYHRILKFRWLNFLKILNRRNHKKVWIIDNIKIFLGSANMISVHSSRSKGGESWKDASIEFSSDSENTEFNRILQSFEKIWNRPQLKRFLKVKKGFWKKVKEGTDEALVHLNDSTRKRRSIKVQNKKRFDRAQKRIWLANPYFAAPPSMVRALCRAAKSGVDVRILVPLKSDIPIMRLVMFGYYETLLKSGVKLFAYEPSVYHAKIRIVDDHYVVGSSNLDYRSLLYNLEIDVQVTQDSNQVALEQDLLIDFAENSIPITREDVKNESFLFRIGARLFSFVKYWV